VPRDLTTILGGSAAQTGAVISTSVVHSDQHSSLSVMVATDVTRGQPRQPARASRWEVQLSAERIDLS